MSNVIPGVVAEEAVKFSAETLTNTVTPFRPVRCTEKAKDKRDPVEGFVYYTTDSKKIYLGSNGKYLPMGGNSGIYYGEKTIPEEEAENPSVTFYSAEIEGDITPNANDLILNIPDGCFYRIISVIQTSDTDYEAYTERLTIAGSGSGGGGGASGGIAITDIDNTYAKFFTVDEESMKIRFICRSQNTENNFVASIEYYIGSRLIYTDNNSHQFGDTITFDLKPYANLLTTGSQNTLRVGVRDAYNTGNQFSGSKYYYINLIELKITSDYDLISTASGDVLNYSCLPSGGKTLDNKYVHIRLTAENNPTNLIYENKISIQYPGEKITHQVELKGCIHGVYDLEAIFYGVLPDGNIIGSNAVKHKVIYYDNNVNTPLLAAYLPTTQIQQYEDLTVTYMIVDKNSITTNVPVYLYVNEDRTDVTAALETLTQWKKTYINEGVYTLKITYSSLTKEIGKINVKKYAGDIPVIDTNPSDVVLELYLTSQGRSNAESNKNSWEWTFRENTYTTQFNNFLWGSTNGWLEDEDGATALHLTNGAKIEVENYFPFVQDASLSGLTIELDFAVSGVLNYSKPLISCLSERTIDGKREIFTGFQITGQKATLNSDIIKASTTDISGEGDDEGNITNVNDLSLQAYTQYFKEGERVHLTYVIESLPSSVTSNDFYYVFTYLNGILSGIGRISANSSVSHESFIQMPSYPAKFVVDSTYGDIDLYNVRFYRNGLSKRTVVNNWIADLTDIDQKIELYKENNILEDDGSISLKAIQDINYQLKVPYVLFNGGLKGMKKKKTDAFSVSEINYDLPFTKSDYRLFSMKMVDDFNPQYNMDIPIILESSDNGEQINQFNQIKTGVNYKPKRGVQVYGQGTSSMIYPVKNLRLRFIQENDYPTVYEGSCPVEIVCFKADFMDSSSSHNTGTANLVYNLLQNMNLRTPPQQFMLEHGSKLENRYDITTAIRGYPIVCFYAEGDSEDYKFIGRYNFNIDKATPEPFGFPPMKYYTGRFTSTGRQEVVCCGLATEEVEGMTVLPIDEEGNEIEKDLTQCWEMKNNDLNSPTKFLTLTGYTSFMESLTKGNNWLNFYEDRYPDEIVGATEDGEDTSEATAAWFALCNWLNSYQIFDGNGKYIDIPDEDPIIIKALSQSQDAGDLPLDLTTLSFEPTKDQQTGETFIPGERAITLALTAVDAYSEENYQYVYENRAKLSGFLQILYEKKNRFRAEFEDHLDLDFCLFYYCLTMTLLMMDSRAKNMMIATWDQKKWYPIFYDMDSMLGINNTGFNKFSFQTEDEILNKVFTGFDSVLWNNLRECYYSNICYFYTQMRSNGLDLQTLLKTYNEGSADAWNEVISTADAEYKYIRPFEEGYYNGKDGVQVGPGKKNYLYAGQGPRSAHRAWWLQNRLTYLDGKYKSPTYKDGVSDLGDVINFRCLAGPTQQVSDIEAYEKCLELAPPTRLFNITSLNDAYHAMLFGSIVYGPIKLKAGETGQLGQPTASQEVEAQLFQAHTIASVGDLSDKYLGDVFLPTTVQTKLTELSLGRSKRSHPDAWEGYFNENITKIDIRDTCPYLNYLNVAHLTNLGNLDLSDCKRLMELDATGCTALSNITFPQDSILEKLYLPVKISKLQLINQPYLDTIEFDEGVDLYQLYLDRVPLLNSYELAKSVFFNVEDVEKSYYLTDVNWIIDNDNDLEIIDGEIDSIKLLNILGFSSNVVSALGEGKKAASLTGTITIKSSTPVNEYTLYKKYSAVFPNIVIKYDQSMYDNNLITPAIKLQFMNSDDRSTAIPYFEVLSDGTESLNVLVGNRNTQIPGVNGSYLSEPKKPDTEEFTYTFSNIWKAVSEDGTSIKLYENEQNQEDEEEGKERVYFYDFIPTENMIFYPFFKSEVRDYNIIVYDWDETIIHKQKYPYGTIVGGISAIPSFIYRPETDTMAHNERYTFMGYISASDFANQEFEPTILDLSTILLNKDFIAYAYYKIENAATTPSPMKYFRTTKTNTGVKIDIVDDTIRREIQGKITLPSVTENGQDITEIGDFINTTGITHVYFLPDAKYTTILGNSGFGVTLDQIMNTQLKQVYLPTSMTTIGAGAFKNCIKLQSANIENLDKLLVIGNDAFHSEQANNPMIIAISNLPKSLTTLGSNTFCNGGPNIYIDNSKIPLGLTVLPNRVFMNCENVCITILGGSANNITICGDDCCYGTKVHNVDFKIYDNVTRIGTEAFSKRGEKSRSVSFGLNAETAIELYNLGVPTAPFITDVWEYDVPSLKTNV